MTRKTLFAVIAVVVALAIATVLWVNRPGSSEPVSSPTPAVGKSLAPTSPPEPTPSLDAREAVIAEAEAVYQQYSDAIWDMSKGQGAKDLVEKVHPYTSGENWKAVQDEAKLLRSAPDDVSGELQVHFRRPSDINITTEPATLTLNVCLDLRDAATRDARNKKINPTWIASRVFMLKKGNTWKVDDRSDKISDKPCIE